MEEIPPGQEMLETQISVIDVAEIVRVRYRCSTLIDLAWSQALQDKRAKSETDILWGRCRYLPK